MLFTEGIRKSTEEPSMNSRTRTFTSSEIIEITSNFKNMIGKGGFGEVYFGTLKDGTDVAVKKLLSSSEQCRKAFITEVKLLTDVHQRNLVSLEGYCDEVGEEALILEYMSKGSLKQHLSDKSRRVLSWTQRLQIAIDVACGLEYLHGQKPPIVHRDLAPANILFNKYMQAKIADFGVSRAFATDSATHLTTQMATGTPGYRDPDSWMTGRIRKENDVYSFGIILLELVTGKPAIITRDTDEWIRIIAWIDPFFKRGDILKIVDPRLNGKLNISVARKVIKIAMSCVKPIDESPDISQILTKLKECLGLSRVLDDTSRSSILAGLLRSIRQRQKGNTMKSMVEQQPLNLGNITIFTHSEVATITSNFKEVIEEGTLYKVYLGTLNDGTHVAVKIWSPCRLSSNQASYEFRTEVEKLSPLCHRNVVFAVGYCDENKTKALIYEYMANGNLRQYLSGEYKRILCWNERLQIAIDIAHGLQYLQTGCTSFVVHGNLNPSVIFLDENMQGKIAYFINAKFLHEKIERHTVYRTTPAYFDPQSRRTLKVNKKTDLFSFGIILLELLTGWPAMAYEYKPRLYIVHRVESIMKTGDIKRLVDPRLQGKFNTNTASKVAKLAMSCALISADRRPDLSHVLVELKECLALEMHSQQNRGDNLCGPPSSVTGFHGRNIWDLKLPEKIKLMIWSAYKGILPLKDNLCKKQIPVDNFCPVCNLEGETTLHVVKECEVARAVWLGSSLSLRVSEIRAQDFAEFFEIMASFMEREQLELACVLCWLLWANRNDALWNGKYQLPSQIVSHGVQFSRELKVVINTSKNVSQQCVSTW